MVLFYIYSCHWIILSYTTSLIFWVSIWLLNYISPLQDCGISLTGFKDFRKCLPCSFIDPLVKGTDNFWKNCGLVDGFYESRRHIASGVEKMADESMSAIKYFTTPKGDLLHYSYIFRKSEPLAIEMKNVACSRFGTLLHIETQKWKEAVKTSKFQKDLRGTTSCMKRLDIATKGCGQLTSNDT